MPTCSPCLPWCDQHNDAAAECLTLRCIYSRDEDPQAPPGPPATASLAAQFRTLGGFPDSIDTIFVEVSYIPGEEDGPEMVLRFRDITKGQDSAILSTTIAGLKQLHAKLGGFIAELDRAA